MIHWLKRNAASVTNAAPGKVRFFIDESGLPKAKDESGTLIDLIGPTGPAGATGPTGATGPAGPETATYTFATRPLTGNTVGDEIIVTDLTPRQRWSWNGTAWTPMSGRLTLLNATLATPTTLTGTTTATPLSGASVTAPAGLLAAGWRLTFRAMVDRNAVGIGTITMTPRIGGVNQESRSLTTTTLALALDTDYGFASDTVVRRQGGVSRNASSATSTFGAATIPSTATNATAIELLATLANAADSVTLYSVAYELLAPA